jgi:hypothetical protein
MHLKILIKNKWYKLDLKVKFRFFKEQLNGKKKNKKKFNKDK